MPRNVSNITAGLNLNPKFKVAIFYGDVKAKYLQNLPNNIEMIIINRLIGKAQYTQRYQRGTSLHYPYISQMHREGDVMSEEVFNNFPYSLNSLYINQTNLKPKNIRVPFGTENVDIIDHLVNEFILQQNNKNCCGDCNCSDTCNYCGSCCDCEDDPFITCGKRDAIEAKIRFQDYVKIAYRNYDESEICHVLNLEPEYKRMLRVQNADGNFYNSVRDYAHLMKVKKGRSLFAYHTWSQEVPAFMIAEFFDDAEKGKCDRERYDLDYYFKMYYDKKDAREAPEVAKTKDIAVAQNNYNRKLKNLKECKREYDFICKRASGKKIEGVETPSIDEMITAKHKVSNAKAEVDYHRKQLLALTA